MTTAPPSKMSLQKQSRLLPPAPKQSNLPHLSPQHNYQSLQHHHHHHQQQQHHRPGFDSEGQQQAGFSHQRSGIPQSFSFVESRQDRLTEVKKDKREGESNTLKLPHSSSNKPPQILPRQRQPSPKHNGEPYVAVHFQNSPRKQQVKVAQSSFNTGELDDAEKLKVLTQHIEIYTNWANHYLERANNRRLICNLQWDFREGILLADLIEAVVDEKVPNIQRPAQNYSQVLQNTTECFNFLTARHVDLRSIEPKDICQGNLKSILELFFTLSRYKQLQKQTSSSTISQTGTRSSSPATKKDGVLKQTGSTPPATTTSALVAPTSKMKGDLSGIASFNRRDKLPTSSSSSTSSTSANHNQPEVPTIEQNNNNIDNKTEMADARTESNTSSPNKCKTSTGNDSGAKKTSMLTKLKLFGSKKKDEGNSNLKGSDKKSRDDVIETGGEGWSPRIATQPPQTRLPMPPPREPIVHHHHLPHREVPKPAVPERTVTLPGSSARHLPQPQLPQRNTHQSPSIQAASHSDPNRTPARSALKDVQTSLPRRDHDHSNNTMEKKLKKQPNQQHAFKPNENQLNLSTESSSSSPSHHPSSRLPNRTSSSTSISSMASCGSSFTSGVGSLKKGSNSNLRKPTTTTTRSSAIPAPSVKKPTSATTNMTNKLNTSEGNIIGGGVKSANSRLASTTKSSKVQRALSAKEDATKIARDNQIVPDMAEKSVSCSNTPLLDSNSLRRIPKGLKVEDHKNTNEVKSSSLQAKNSSLKKASKLGIASVRQLPMTNSTKIQKSSNLQPLNESVPLKLNTETFKNEKYRGSCDTLEDTSSGLEFSTDDDDGNTSPGQTSALKRERSQHSFGSSGLEEDESNNSTSESTESVIYQPSSGKCVDNSKTRSDVINIRSVASTSINNNNNEDDYNDDDDDDDDDEIGVIEEEEDEDGEMNKGDHIVNLRKNKDKIKAEKSQDDAHKTKIQSVDDPVQRNDETFELKPMEPFTRTTASSYMLGSCGKSSANGKDVSSRDSGFMSQPCYGSKYQPSAFLERDERAGEAASGYMSDGDILRSRRCGRQDYCATTFRRHTDDSYCGYTSEGGSGASLYAKRMQQKFMEGIMAAQECLEKKPVDDESSFDNYSSDSSEDLQEEGQANESTAEYISENPSKNNPPSFPSTRIFNPHIPLNFTSKTFPISVTQTPGHQQNQNLIRSPGIFSDIERRTSLADTIRNHCFSSSLDGTIGSPRGRPLFERGIRERASLPIIGTHPGGFLTRRGLHPVPPIPEVVERVSPVVARKDTTTNVDTLRSQEPTSSGSEVSSASPTPHSTMKGSSMSINGSSLSISGRSKSKNSRLLSPVVAEREAMKGERLSNYSKGVMIYPVRQKIGQDIPITPQQQIIFQQQHQQQQHQQQQHQQQQQQQQQFSPGNGTLRRRGSSGCADGISKWPYGTHPSLSQFNLDPNKLNHENNNHDIVVQNHWNVTTLPAAAFPNPLQIPSNRTLGPKLSMPNKYAANYDLANKPTNNIMLPHTSSASLPRQNHYHNIHQSKIMGTPTSPIYGGNTPVPPQIFTRFQSPMGGNYGGQNYVAPLFGNQTSNSYHREENASGRESSLSLGSSATSAYSNAEDQQQQHEVKRLRHELENAQSRVDTLSSQLNTNAHVVIAFEQSLANMTRRLHHLTNATNQKDVELNELRMIIDQLKQHGARVKQESSSSSSSSQNRQSTGSAGMFSMTKGKDALKEGSVAELRRHMSSDSVVSSVSGISHHSGSTAESEKKKKQKSWLASFGKAFSRRKHQASSCTNGSGPITTNPNKSLCSDAESDTGSLYSDASMVHVHSPSPRHPLGANIHPLSLPTSPIRSSKIEPITPTTTSGEQESVTNLQQQLREKDMKLTDIQLEALSSAHQLEHLKETMNRMKNEMMSLKVENDRMQKLITQRGVTSSATNPPPSKNPPKEERLSLGDPSNYDLLLMDGGSRDYRKTTLSIKITPNKSTDSTTEVLVSTIPVSGNTTWAHLFSTIKSNFKDYLVQLDPNSSLGLAPDSISALNIGELTWSKESPPPELLPCGYLVGDSTNISVILRGSCDGNVDGLAFETLIPKSILQRYVSLLLEHKRIILCGPSGTGKTHLAQKLAEHIVVCSGKNLKNDSIAMFNVDHKTSKELRQYLSNIADQCEHAVADLPDVIILDSLHHVSSLREVFDSFLSVKNETSPYIIGTMSQAANSSSSTNLQLHHNFRWVLCANHVEPVKGFLGRYLKKKMIEAQVKLANHGGGDLEEGIQKLSQVVDWLPKVWQHLNKCLEAHSSSEVTIGPRLFLSCPIEIDLMQNWFTDLWNYSIVPYMLEAIREGIQTYGSRVTWEDPADWVIRTFPWTNGQSGQMTSSEEEWPPLLKIRPEDVGHDSQGISNSTTSSANNNNSTPMSPNPVMSGSGEGGRQNKNMSALNHSSNSNDHEEQSDPLLNMLLRLQEAASYTSPSTSDIEFVSTNDKTYSMVDQI